MVIRYQFRSVAVSAMRRPCTDRYRASRYRRHDRLDHYANARIRFTRNARLRVNYTLDGSRPCTRRTYRRTRQIGRLRRIANMMRARVFVGIRQCTLRRIARHCAGCRQQGRTAGRSTPIPRIAPTNFFGLKTMIGASQARRREHRRRSRHRVRTKRHDNVSRQPNDGRYTTHNSRPGLIAIPI